MNHIPDIQSFQDFERETAAIVSVPRFRPITFQQAVSRAPEYRWVLDRLVPERALVVVASPPKIGKSFLVADWSLHVAMGQHWGDVEVEHGGVIYCTGEGQQGFAKRLKAWNQENGDPGTIPFVVLTERVNLLDAEVVKIFIEELKRHRDAMSVRLQMVAIDTVARFMIGGDENSGKDMGQFIDNVEKIKDALECTVLLVHHMGKDRTKGMRGHTSLAGAADTLIELGRDESRLITVQVTDQKDEESGLKYPFRLRRVVVGQDDRNRDISSCVVVRADEEVGAQRKRGPQLKGDMKNAMNALTQCLLSYGVLPGTTQVPKDMQAVEGKRWREECYRGWLSLVEDEKTRDRKFQMAVRELTAKSLVGISAPWVWRVRQEG